jgi:2-oxo-4-hydroxy-4-carboxy-5-ureidoimidazoline decarboxylase
MPVADSANIQRFNEQAADELRPDLLRCVAVPRWADTLVDGRPYADLADLLRVADELTARLTDDEVRLALADHPKIGQRTNSAWSRTEQSGVDDRDADLAERLRDGNIAYEARFGHIYLVCATGRSGTEMLADLTARLANDPVTEIGVVRRELAKIAALRLRRVAAGE